MLVIIITGGEPFSSAGRSVEVLKEDGSQLCSLPDLPSDRKLHTQSGLVTCGGNGVNKSCIAFSDGTWSVSHTLMEQRYYHTAWSSPLGIILIGGGASPNTAELLNDNGGSQQIFGLMYKHKFT